MDIRNGWTINDIMNAHDMLDALDAAERRAAAAAQTGK